MQLSSVFPLALFNAGGTNHSQLDALLKNGIGHVSALGLIGVALLHVWLRLQVVHMGYVLATTSKLQNQLEQENRELKVELATLMSPDRLEAMSRKRLGLRPPEKGQVIVLP